MVKADMETASPTRKGTLRSSLPEAKAFFSRRWWWTTLLVLLGLAVLIRLGLWQLDRREQRRAYNTAILQQLALPPMPLNDDAMPIDLGELKNRQALVRGEYDLSRQVALAHQNWMGEPGLHLITPLVIEGANGSSEGGPKAVLVDRGWLPASALSTEHWSQFNIIGPVTVTGYIKLSQSLPGSANPNQVPSVPQQEWYRVDVAAIEAQMPYKLLPIYLQEAPPSDGDTELPFRSELDNDLSEGNHLSYAIQWFIFATILAVGYVYFVGKKTHETLPSDR